MNNDSGVGCKTITKMCIMWNCFSLIMDEGLFIYLGFRSNKDIFMHESEKRTHTVQLSSGKIICQYFVSSGKGQGWMKVTFGNVSHWRNITE